MPKAQKYTPFIFIFFFAWCRAVGRERKRRESEDTASPIESKQEANNLKDVITQMIGTRPSSVQRPPHSESPRHPKHAGCSGSARACVRPPRSVGPLGATPVPSPRPQTRARGGFSVRARFVNKGDEEKFATPGAAPYR